MTCRICGLDSAKEIGEVEYYLGFASSIYDCARCGCRFTRHDNSIHEWLHREANSSYALYRELLEECKRFFDVEDIEGLRSELCANSKYRWIIEAIEQRAKSDRILEIGCSRGYFTSYFILAGYKVLGVDVSAEAVNAARGAFGACLRARRRPACDARQRSIAALDDCRRLLALDLGEPYVRQHAVGRRAVPLTMRVGCRPAGRARRS